MSTGVDAKIRKLIRQVEASRKAIATERDKLREALSELTDLLESTDEGLRSLDSAVDHFSEYL